MFPFISRKCYRILVSVMMLVESIELIHIRLHLALDSSALIMQVLEFLKENGRAF